MRLLGFDITLAKAAPVNLQSVSDRGHWWPIVREPFTGAWQRNMELRRETILTYSPVYACVTLISSDVGKLGGARLVEESNVGVWTPTKSPAFSPVLRRPNRYQNRIKFFEQWVVSKLLHGNTYVLKERDNRGVVIAMYVLDPTRTKVLVAPDGSVFYEVRKDNLSGIEAETIAIPASEIIHDVMVPLYHPLVGVSPITACGLAAAQGIAIQNNSTTFFDKGSRPSGILTAAGHIDDATAKRLKLYWESEFAGSKTGAIAVLGDGLTFESMSMSSVDSQLIEQLKWSAETVCSCFHVPPYMIGVGPMPSYNNIQALNQQYYSQCLQSLIECIELCLDEGLGLVDAPDQSYGSEFDLEGLLRMDTATQYKTIAEGIRGGFVAPNEGRQKIGLKPVRGGDSPMMQHQDYSLEALAKRDAKDDPFEGANTPSTPNKPANDNVATDEEIESAKHIAVWKLKSLLAIPA